MSVFDGVQSDLESLGDDVPASGLGAQALEIARGLDNPKNSLTAKAMAGKTLIETMERLRELHPPKPEEDEVERARKRRAKRLERKSASGAAPPSP